MRFLSRNIPESLFILAVFVFGCGPEKLAKAPPVKSDKSISDRNLIAGIVDYRRDSLLTDLEPLIEKYYSWLGLESPPAGTHERLVGVVRLAREGTKAQSRNIHDAIGILIQDISLRLGRRRKNPNVMFSPTVVTFLAFARSLTSFGGVNCADPGAQTYHGYQLSRLRTGTVATKPGSLVNIFHERIMKIKSLFDTQPGHADSLERVIVLDEKIEMLSGWRSLQSGFEDELLACIFTLRNMCTSPMRLSGATGDALCVDAMLVYEDGLTSYAASGDFEQGRAKLYAAWTKLEELKSIENEVHVMGDVLPHDAV